MKKPKPRKAADAEKIRMYDNDVRGRCFLASNFDLYYPQLNQRIVVPTLRKHTPR